VHLALSHPAEKTCIVFVHTYFLAYLKSEKGSMIYPKLDKPRRRQCDEHAVPNVGEKKCEAKVKQSLYWPGQALRVPGD